MDKTNLPLSGDKKQANGFRLDGKVAIITGAASGIGRAIAQRFAQVGAIVRLVDINEQEAADTAQEIAASGGSATAHSCDVSNQPSVSELFRKLAGEMPIHILVNNAG